MNRQKSKEFLKAMAIVCSLWFVLGIFITRNNAEDLSAFVRIYLFTCLDLSFLILLFWTLFFSVAARSIKSLQILIFFTFKLVCLAFLAITLKRLNNASPEAIGMGIGFIGFGPILASVWMKKGNN